jgi:hypothetical protein
MGRSTSAQRNHITQSQPFFLAPPSRDFDCLYSLESSLGRCRVLLALLLAQSSFHEACLSNNARRVRPKPISPGFAFQVWSPSWQSSPETAGEQA